MYTQCSYGTIAGSYSKSATEYVLHNEQTADEKSIGCYGLVHFQTKLK